MKKLSFVLAEHEYTGSRYFIWQFTVNDKVVRQGETAYLGDANDAKFIHIDKNGDLFASEEYRGVFAGQSEHSGFGYDWLADMVDESDREVGVSLALFIEKNWQCLYWPISSLAVGNEISISLE